MITQLPQVVRRLQQEFQNNPIKTSPSSVNRETIVQLMDDFQQVLFPGHFGPQEFVYNPTTLMEHLGSIHWTLARQIHDSEDHECCASNDPETKKNDAHCCKRFKESFKIASQLIEKLPTIRHMLAHDVQAAYDGDPATGSYEEIILSYPGIYAIMSHRLAHELHTLGVRLIPRIMTEHAHNLTGIDIHPGATIGSHFFIDHGTGVVIGETCEIGNHVKVYQGVTLGALSFKTDEVGNLVRGTKRHPTIEDHVTIYSGATILGGNTVIGEGSVIGGNVWLIQSVPANSKIISKPAIEWR
ncbi:hypothetical protein BEP19_04310 [Ammoniphilus oxalaticus]|uniref:Uncharacterized protein n=2 Tax=Ammoniphilus oxalaticus TaxID=66863 RepID=A0A419SMB4_9BACL|nr:hypothetical protein BEP19_04310 [Ammoniphilus oxalaticus]